MVTAVPLVVESLGSVRHSPLSLSTYSPLAWWVHTSDVAPWHVARTSLVPVPPLPGSDRHSPNTVSWPPLNVHSCAPRPRIEPSGLQWNTFTALPTVAMLLLSLRHILADVSLS